MHLTESALLMQFPIAYCKLIAGRLLLSSVITRQVMQKKAHLSFKTERKVYRDDTQEWAKMQNHNPDSVSGSLTKEDKNIGVESWCGQMSTLMKHYPRVGEEHGGGRREVLD